MSLKTMLIDTHTHLSDSKFSDIKSVIYRAEKSDVKNFIVPTTSISDLRKTVDFVKKYKQVFVLAGVHPEEIGSINDSDIMVSEMERLISKNKHVIGIGEIGLDFYYDKEKLSIVKQVDVFRKQLDLAVRLNLPVAIHMREAETETLEVLNSLDVRPIGQFHCFAGSSTFLKKAVEWGFYISFAGNITYKSATELRTLLKQVPLERLLLETDSPYLAPEPVRGTINEPANVKILAEFIAKELGETIEKISEITTQNAKCLYSLDI